jgi:hypothetical protein
MLCAQSSTPADGRKDCPKHIEWYSINSKIVHLVGFTIEMYPDAWSHERQTATFVLGTRHWAVNGTQPPTLHWVTLIVTGLSITAQPTHFRTAPVKETGDTRGEEKHRCEIWGWELRAMLLNRIKLSYYVYQNIVCWYETVFRIQGFCVD